MLAGLEIAEPKEGDQLDESSKPHALPEGCTTCPFLEVPYELRADIYKYILPTTVRHEQRGPAWLRSTAAPWGTTSQIYSECIGLIYGKSTFLIDVHYDRVDFLCQWFHQSSLDTQSALIPKRAFAFPEKIPPRNRQFMRKFEVRIHQVDGYTGMIKYNYSNPEVLAMGVKRQIEKLCKVLGDIAEIRELNIRYISKDPDSDQFLNLVMEPFRSLKNTQAATVQGFRHAKAALRRDLQEYLHGAFGRNSIMCLPMELREIIYRYILPCSTISFVDGTRHVKWHRRSTGILRTCKKIHTEASRILYGTNEFEITCFPSLAIEYTALWSDRPENMWRKWDREVCWGNGAWFGRTVGIRCITLYLVGWEGQEISVRKVVKALCKFLEEAKRIDSSTTLQVQAASGTSFLANGRNIAGEIEQKFQQIMPRILEDRKGTL
ncbi:hypothetical protein MMC28_009993 [Mycoblastus sanguinarius]|nr:hypothetical protein [Mycoblastus sanguinarius]